MNFDHSIQNQHDTEIRFTVERSNNFQMKKAFHKNHHQNHHKGVFIPPKRDNEFYKDKTINILLLSRFASREGGLWDRCFQSFFDTMHDPKFAESKIEIYHSESEYDLVLNELFKKHEYTSFPPNVEFKTIPLALSDENFYNVDEDTDMVFIDDFIEKKQNPTDIMIATFFFDDQDPHEGRKRYYFDMKDICVKNGIFFNQKRPVHLFRVLDIDCATQPKFFPHNQPLPQIPYEQIVQRQPAKRFRPEEGEIRHERSPPHIPSISSPSSSSSHPPQDLIDKLASSGLTNDDFKKLGLEHLAKRQQLPHHHVDFRHYPDGSLFQIITTITFRSNNN